MNDAPTLARERWTSHPNYPAHVLLLGSHHNFRRINRFLVEQTGRPESLLRPLRQLYTRWISAMRSHERYEEYKLYPYLTRRWGASFAAAEAGHAALHQAYDQVIEAFDAEARPTVVDALTHHEAVLRDHLALEEELVIPRLLALEPAEFDAFVGA